MFKRNVFAKPFELHIVTEANLTRRFDQRQTAREYNGISCLKWCGCYAKADLTVGFDLASDCVTTCSLGDKTSLLDWDLVVVRPDISGLIQNEHDPSEYRGRIALNDRNSFYLKEACDHWRREIKEATASGKTVIVHQSRPETVYVATGTVAHSGTGRNRHTTRHVEPWSNYTAIPVSQDWTEAQGSEMVVKPDYQEVFSSYWTRFSRSSRYEITYPPSIKGACITTKHGGKVVGQVHRHKASGGCLLLLPNLDFEPDDFLEWRDGAEFFTEKAEIFARHYLAEINLLDAAVKGLAAKSPEPEWVMQEKYCIPSEAALRERLLQAERKLEEAQRLKERILDELSDARQPLDLLYETGRPLEKAIILALQVLGFEAESYEESSSEFDAVFECAEGRFLGEAEGKDTKAIAIGKLRQLSMNIHEDLSREKVSKPAKGILFGNAFRLSQPDDRKEFFTDKCMESAVSLSLGLVSTVDLFQVSRYIADSGDRTFAEACRRALLEGVGLIRFPIVPIRPQEGECRLGDS